MTNHTRTSQGRRPSAAAILLVPVVVALVLTLFAWPSARMEPRDLPIGVVGQHELAAPEGAFDVHRYADESAAREAIRDRENDQRQARPGVMGVDRKAGREGALRKLAGRGRRTHVHHLVHRQRDERRRR